MRKKMSLLVIVAFLVASAYGTLIVIAGTSYIEIVFRIPTGKVQDFLDGFLAMEPIPTTVDPNDPNEQIPQYAAKEWIKLCGRRYYMRVYRNGKARLAEQTAIKDPNIFE